MYEFKRRMFFRLSLFPWKPCFFHLRFFNFSDKRAVFLRWVMIWLWSSWSIQADIHKQWKAPWSLEPYGLCLKQIDGEREWMGKKGADGKYFHGVNFVTEEMSVWPVNKSSRGCVVAFCLVVVKTSKWRMTGSDCVIAVSFFRTRALCIWRNSRGPFMCSNSYSGCITAGWNINQRSSWD